MDFTFNELSLNKFNDEEESYNSFIQLSKIIKQLHIVGFKAIKFWDKSELMNFEYVNTLKFSEWLRAKRFFNDECRTASRYLLGIITKKDSKCNDDEEKVILDCPIIGIQLENKEAISKGLKLAHIYNTIALSFNSNVVWDTPIIKAKYLNEDDSGNLIEESCEIRHASKITHLDRHVEWFKILAQKQKILANWNPSEKYFPCLEFSNDLVPSGDWNVYRKERDSGSVNDRLAIIMVYAKRVAERNGYTYNKFLSALNTTEKKKRIIYNAGKGRDTIYLSVDFDKGGFEVCNHLGKHLGEYFFDGNMVSGPKTGHDILIHT